MLISPCRQITFLVGFLRFSQLQNSSVQVDFDNFLHLLEYEV